MSFSIKNFTVLNTTTGVMPITGRYTSSQINNILSHTTLINGVTEQQTVPGMPTTISSSSSMYNKAHICTGYIKLIDSYLKNTSGDAIFVPDGILRICYLGGTTSAKNSVIYGFAPATSTAIANITWDVLIAVNTTQTLGDYWDIILPDRTFYPNLYLAIIVLNDSWSSRTIVSGTTCNITNTTPNFCIDSSKSVTDTNTAHFINLQGYNSNYGVLTRLVIGIEDWYSSLTDNDFNDILLAVSSKFYSELQINDTSSS